MRVLAIGDVHGCSDAWDALLEIVAPGGDDQLITLGDYVDRGPDSRGVLERILKLEQTLRLVALRGNHEQMMLDAREHDFDFWYACGGRETLRSYDAAESLDCVPQEHWDFIEKRCVNYYETETHFFVHASVDPHVPLCEQDPFYLIWQKLLSNIAPHCSGKVMICGHTPQASGEPLNLGHAVCIDTWVYGSGWLTCLDVQSGRYWQANQDRQTREGCL